MPPLDRIVGRAVIDPAFCSLLLRDPVAALAAEPMPLRLKRALVAIRARGLGDFARQALDVEAALRARRRPWLPLPDRPGRSARDDIQAYPRNRAMLGS